MKTKGASHRLPARPCAFCGEAFAPRVETYHGKRAKKLPKACCSPSCRKQLRDREEGLSPVARCAWCGTEFVARVMKEAGIRARFCSRSCGGYARSTSDRGSSVGKVWPESRRVRKFVECAWCGQEFRQKDSDQRCCSFRCARRWGDAHGPRMRHGQPSGTTGTLYQRRRDAPGFHTADDIRRLKEEQAGMCAYCGVNLAAGFEQDHVVPLTRGGTNDISNIVLACPRCNRSKCDQLLDAWLAKHPEIEPRIYQKRLV